jgi:hypothetical protein
MAFRRCKGLCKTAGGCPSFHVVRLGVNGCNMDCVHDYQLETVGGVFLTGAYVCRLCSHRIGMSHDQFNRQATYPGLYQAEVSVAETVEERAHHARERYVQRLRDQMRELSGENLPSVLSEDERHEILTEVIQEALLQVVKDCQEFAKDSGLSEGKVVAELIERKIGGRRNPTASSSPATPRSRSRSDS